MAGAARQIWFLTGSQDLYGEATLAKVAEQSQALVAELNAADEIPVEIVWKPVLTTSDAIRRQILDANSADEVVGLIAWMHTFSPAKQWIRGLSLIAKPLLRLHTQARVELPFATIDQEFMNLNQSAHGDREFAYMLTRMGIGRKSVVGHSSSPRVRRQIGAWARAAIGRDELSHLTVIRFGDNMRRVADTDGDRVEAEIKLGTAVDTWASSEVAAVVDAAPPQQVQALVDEYLTHYDVAPELRPDGSRHQALRDAAAQEWGIKTFLDERGARAWVSNFQDLGGLRQLPGLAAQRLQEQGYGFGPEGDWRTAILVRAALAMGEGLPGGASMMEEYTYNLVDGEEGILGSHMLEVAPGLTTSRPRLEQHPLSIVPGDDPVRLVFDADPAGGVLVDMVDMGDHLRLIGTEVEIVAPDAPLPALPTARAYWRPQPSFTAVVEAALAAGGSHHHVLSTLGGIEIWADLARMLDLEWLPLSGSQAS
jgi:L-arabinose isomerase